MGPVPLLVSPWPALQALRTRKDSTNAVSADDMYALARLGARWYCDGNDVIFNRSILMLSNVDVTNLFVHRTTAFLRPKMNILVQRQFQFTKWVSRLLSWFNLFLYNVPHWEDSVALSIPPVLVFGPQDVQVDSPDPNDPSPKATQWPFSFLP